MRTYIVRKLANVDKRGIQQWSMEIKADGIEGVVAFVRPWCRAGADQPTEPRVEPRPTRVDEWLITYSYREGFHVIVIDGEPYGTKE